MSKRKKTVTSASDEKKRSEKTNLKFKFYYFPYFKIENVKMVKI